MPELTSRLASERYGASKHAALWEPSQNGLFSEWPQRHSAHLSTSRMTCPSELRTITVPLTSNGPFAATVISMLPSLIQVFLSSKSLQLLGPAEFSNLVTQPNRCHLASLRRS